MFENIADTGLRRVDQDPVDAIVTLIGCDDGAVVPSAVAIAIEVVAGLRRKIRPGHIVSPGSVVAGANRGCSRELLRGEVVSRTDDEDGEDCGDAEQYRHMDYSRVLIAIVSALVLRPGRGDTITS
jgi:hypothetical protein